MSHAAQAGFTLLEVLIILAIIGILAAITYAGYQPLRINQQTEEAVSRVMSDFEKMRSTAAKTSRPASITIDPNRPNEYELSYWNGTDYVEQDVELPNSSRIFFNSTATTISYTAPYAEVSTANREITVAPNTYEHAYTGNIPDSGGKRYAKKIYIVGVTGKVHQ